MTVHAGCVDALAEERTLLLCYFIIHRPPGPTPLLLALRLLHALAVTPPGAWAAAAQGGAVYLLTVLLPAAAPDDTFKVPHVCCAAGCALMCHAVLRSTMLWWAVIWCTSSAVNCAASDPS